MNQLFGYLQYFGAVFYLLSVFALVGFSSLYIVRAPKLLSPTESILLAPVIGVAVITIPMTVLASYEIGISSLLVWALVAGICSVAVVMASVKHEIGQVRTLLFQSLRSVRYWIVGISVGFIPYLSLMLKEEFPIGFGTSATWTNNDLGAYIQMATNVGRSGVADAGLVTGWNAGLQASFDHPGSHALFASIARLLHREPYQVGIVLMATVMTVFFLSAVVVISRIGKRPISTMLMIGTVVVAINPPVIAAATNFFYPHLASIAMSLGFCALILILNETAESKGGFVLLGVLTAATWLVSIEIAVVMMSLISLFVLSRKSEMGRVKLLSYLVVGHISVFAMGLLIRFTLFKSQFDVMTRMSTGGVAGWKSNFVSPTMILGVTPTQFGGPYSAGVRFWDVAIVFASLALVTVLTVKKKVDLTIALSCFALNCFVLVAVKKWGIDGYQTWKLVTTFTPFFMILLLILLLSIDTEKLSGSWFLVPLLTVGATYSWSGSIWKDHSASYISQELSQITHMEEIQRQVGLNVLIEPFFPTMSASVMSGVPTRMSSPNYYFFEGQELLYRCTLATEETLKSIENPGPIIARRGHYVLVGTPACD